MLTITLPVLSQTALGFSCNTLFVPKESRYCFFQTRLEDANEILQALQMNYRLPFIPLCGFFSKSCTQGYQDSVKNQDDNLNLVIVKFEHFVRRFQSRKLKSFLRLLLVSPTINKKKGSIQKMFSLPWSSHHRI